MIGNDCFIDIWKDKWIMNSDLGFIRLIMHVSQSVPTKVYDLIDWESYSWQLQLINGLVTERDMQDIEIQMFSDVHVEDKLI